MARDIMIVGAGGWGREAVWTLERINECEETWNILGFADDDPAKATGSVEGYPLLGNVEKASQDHPGAAVYIAIGDNAIRESIYRRLRGHDFPVIIDPSAVVAPTAENMEGKKFVMYNPVYVYSTRYYTVNFVIGENSLKHAYLTVPDLRYSSLTLGLSVDLHWSTGLNFGDVILGGN